MLHSYRVAFWETGSVVPVSIVMLVKGVVPIVVLSLENCDSYSCINNLRSCRTVEESSCHGGLKVLGVTVSDIFFFSVTLFA